MNWKRGFKRITWVLSVLAFVIPAIVYIKESNYRIPVEEHITDFIGFILSWGITGLIVVWAIYVVTLFIAKGFCDDEQKNSFEKGAIMTLKEIAEKTNQLRDIDKNEEHEKAKKLAKAIGASIFDPYAQGKEATTGVIVQNCYRVLQTQTMLVACKTADRSSKIALVAAIAAVLGVLITLVFIFTR